MRRVVVVALLVGCVRSESNTCSFGTCPSGTTCDEVHRLCVTDDQRAACEAKQDGDQCGSGDSAGVCDLGVCLPLEIASWTQWTGGWTGRRDHRAAYDEVKGKLVVVGGNTNVGTVAETWERTSTPASGKSAWHLAGNGPATRFAAIAYDATRSRTVLFGGFDALSTIRSETWEYDGTSWSQIQTGASPAPRYGAAMIFDTARQRIILFGGKTNNDVLLDDTWEYNGTTWTQLAPSPHPSARWLMAFAWDETRNRGVLHGGQPPTGPLLTETWEWSNGQWSAGVATTVGRFHHQLAYLPSRNRLVMFGGVVGGVAASDTWEYDGTWTQVPTVAAPRGRRAFSLTLDRIVGRLVLVGGSTQDGDSSIDAVFDDVWEYGANQGWRPKPARFAPTGRYMSVGGYDMRRETFLVFGGFSPGSAYDKDTWTFDGTEWTEHTPAASPPGRRRHSGTYDVIRERFFIFGGIDPSPRNDTWAWDGVTWSQVTTPSAPPARSEAAFVFDATAGVSILFGGTANGVSLSDTWEFDGSTWMQVLASGAPVATPTVGAYDPVRGGVIHVRTDGTTWLYKDRMWTEVPTSVPAPVRSWPSLAFDPQRQRLALVGGIAQDGEYRGDHWELGPDGWHEVPFEGVLTPRYDSIIGARPRGPGLLIFGGNTPATVSGDLWEFQYR
jgi:hypothetical protein